MKYLLIALGLTLAASAHAGTAFFKYEIEQGMTKLCVYEHLGNIHSITLKSYQLCPITIVV